MTPLPAAPSPDLLACPRGEKAWDDAVKAARRDGTATALAVLLARAEKQCAGLWEPPWALGELRRPETDPKPAEAAYRRALDRARAARDPLGVAWSAYRLAGRLFVAARLPQAESLFREAGTAARTAARPTIEIATLNGRAGIHTARKEYAAALRLLDDVLRRFAEIGREDQARVAELNRALVELELGNAALVEQRLRAIYDASSAPAELWTRATAAQHLGRVYAMTGRPRDAKEWFTKVGVEPADVAARASLHLGRMLLDEGQLDGAERAMTPARDGKCGAEASIYARVWLAEIAARRGRTADSEADLRAIAREARERGLEEPVWLAHWMLGRRLLARGAEADAATELSAAIDSLEMQRGGIDDTHGLRFLAHRADPYADLASVLAARAPEEAFALVERAHARSLRRALADQGTAGARGSAPRARDLPAVRRALQPGELLLEFLLGEERGVAVAVTRDTLRVVRTPGVATFQPLIARWRGALVAPLASAEARFDPEAALRAAETTGRALAEELLAPVGREIAAARTLFVVPDRDLALVPFDALPWPAPGAVLGDERDVTFLPHAGAPRAASTRARRVLLAGDPTPDPEKRFGELPRSRDELASLDAIYRTAATVRLQGASFTRARLDAARPGTFDTIHLATHAEASSWSPERNRVILSGGGTLGVDAIAAMKLDRPLVVLSACRTGEGEVVPGEGVVGLTWAFLRAGTRALVVSLWSVDDSAAAMLMTDFHRGLASGMNPRVALAAARKAQRARTPHPAYWAPFVLVERP